MSLYTHIFYIDLFCGAGGTTTGIERSGAGKVIACVNHDANAINSHKSNHKGVLHFTEDVRNLDVILALKNLAASYRKKYPNCLIILHGSLECTNFSNAKGGKPRDPDSRSLADIIPVYRKHLRPDVITIENVREFMSWGPLDKNGKPISRDKGKYYLRWIKEIESTGYSHDHRLLNAADYGAYTSRIRYFGQFVSNGMNHYWPEPTHHKTGANGLKKWNAVRSVLDLQDRGESIFHRKKPLVENTLKRIYAGLVKFAGPEQRDYLIKTYGVGSKSTGAYSTKNPTTTITTKVAYHLATSQFIQNYYSGGDQFRVKSLDKPCNTVRTNNCQSLVSSEYLIKYYSTGKNVSGSNVPAPTIGTKDTCAKISFMVMQYGNGGFRPVSKPSATVLSNDKHSLTTALIYNPQWGGVFRDIDKPCFTIIARMDKAPPYLTQVQCDTIGTIVINKSDSRYTKRIKGFMIRNGIVDIKMRMLKITELLQIQGFPKGYILKGTKTEQKKYIGNAVECNMAAALAGAFAPLLISNNLKKQSTL